MKKLSALLVFCAATLSQLQAQPVPLGPADWHWNRPLEQIEDIPARETAVYEATGSVLTVGPWIAGRRDVKLVAAKALPARKGSIRGQFRTEGMYPREGNIWIAYRQGRRTITETNYWLERPTPGRSWVLTANPSSHSAAPCKATG